MDGKKIHSGSLPALIEQCEGWMREGQGRKVHDALLRISPADLPRALRLPIANLARRVNHTNFGLRILSPLVQAKNHGFSDEATGAELAEYAMLLHKAGSTREGLQILLRLPARELPEVSFYRALCHMSFWEYRSAQPLLEAYVRSPSISPYQRAVGSVNLAAVHVFLGNRDAARALLEELIPAARASNYRRLAANSLEVMAQLDVQNGDLTRALARITEAHGILDGEPTSDRLFLEKWGAVTQALRTGDPSPLRRFGELARARRYWEGARDADFHLVRLTKDEKLFHYLYFGTPYSEYREYLAANCPFPAPETLEIGTGSDLLDLETAERNGRIVPGLDPGKKIHQFLALLLSDFYRPFRLGTVFGSLFPDESFNILSSPNRIHQLVSRSREVALEAGLPFTVAAEDGSYRLDLASGCRVLLRSAPRFARDHEGAQLARLKNLCGAREFSAREAREALGLPFTSMNRLLKAGIDSGTILREGSGKLTRYRFLGTASAEKKAA